MATEEKKEVVEWKKNPPHLDGVPDLSSLIYLEGQNVLHNLACRYKKHEIYTSISKVLIAVNPFQEVVAYGGELIEQYRKAASSRRAQLPPHVFSVSQLAYYNLVKYKENQSMIVCGESGSGKTESAKHLMRYLAYSKDTDSKTPSIERQVLDANPILESFGNAKTVLNWNSSRFGKFTKIIFGEDNDRIVGSFIETYLLEKSRVVTQEKGERNYHCFYYLCCPDALDAATFKDMALAPASEFHYTNQGGEIRVREVSDGGRFKELMAALLTLRFTETESKELLYVVGGLLHMGNVSYTNNSKDLAEITEDAAKASLANAARLFGVDEKTLGERLCTASLKVRDQVITKPLSVADAQLNRDAIAKALYHGLFLWVVSHINEILFPPGARKTTLKWIGILDVFGFESFENNSFEQFCINFANERLQQYFNQHIIKSEQDLYRSESIMWTPIKVPDNQDCIDLIDGKVKGILVLLDSSCKMPKADDVLFVQNLFSMNKYHPRMRKVERVRNTKTNEIDAMNGFSIHHYAGKVVYNAAEFLTKNMDQTSPDTVKLFCSSSKEVTRQLLEDDDMKKAREEEKKKAADKPAAGGVKGKFAAFEQKKPVGRVSAAPAGGARQADTAFKSVGAYFSTQLEKLMKTLYETTPFFVRCIKPNRKKIPADFDWDYVRPQLECGGIIEALRILKCGFPSRCTYDAIFKRYGSILHPTPPHLNKRDFCEAVLRNAGETLDRTEFQLGLSKVFFRPGKQAFLEDLLEGDSELPATTVERIKMFLLNKRLQRARGAVRVHIGFKLRLRQMRAVIRVWKLGHMMRVIAATTFMRLKKIRLRIAANKLQSFIVSHFLVKAQAKKKKAAVTIQKFYQHNRFRKSMNKELKVRIEKKRASLAEAKRKELERLEQERKDRAVFEAADRERKRAQEEIDRARKEKEKLEAIQRQKEEEERARVEAEQRERLKLEREKEEAMRQAQLLKKQLEDEAKKRELEQQRREEEEKAALEQSKKEEQERKLALDLREFELNEREQKMQAQLEAKGPVAAKEQTDKMTHLVTRGTTFFRFQGKIEEANTVNVNVTEEGVLRWIESETVTDKGETPQGDVKLKLVTRIKAGPRKVPGRDEIAKDSNVFLSIESTIENDDKNTEYLELQAGTPEMRDKWVTALRYCVRNVKELGTIGRPKGDLARGNILAAMLTDELNDFKEKNKKLKAQLTTAPGRRGSASGAPGTGGGGTGGGSPEVVEENKKLRAQIEAFKKQNQKLVATAQREKTKRKSTQKQQALTSLLEEKKKILILEEKNQQLTEQNAKLIERNQVLLEELETQKVIHADDRNAAKLREEQLKAEIERKLADAKSSVEAAETKVVQAESAVRKRQDVIRNSMKVLAERKTALSNTEQTMQVLGITGADPTSLEDSTARRLAELHQQQRREQQEAEAVLLKEYAAMVAEAESLNEMNEELARKTYVKEKHEALHKQMQTVQQQRSVGATPSKAGGAKAGGAAGGAAGAAGGAAGAAGAAGPGGVPGKDDGCVIS